MFRRITTVTAAALATIVFISVINCIIVSDVTDLQSASDNFNTLQASVSPILLFDELSNSPEKPGSDSMSLLTTGTSTDRLYTYAGVIHVHTHYSDGGGSMEEVAAIADSLGLDFIIPADHNTLQPLLDGWSRRAGNILVIPGVEHSMDRGAGHYLAIGDSLTLVRSSTVSSDSVLKRMLTPANLIFLAHVHHPVHNSWQDWSIEGYTGIEIFNLDENWRDNIHPFRVSRLIAAAMVYPFRDTAIENVISYPEKQMRTFDSLNMTRKVVAIGSTDAHAKSLFGEPGTIGLPSYESMFKTVQTIVITSELYNGDYQHDRSLVLDALRNGNSYVGFPNAGEIKGFLFSVESASLVAIPGDSLRIEDTVRFKLVIPEGRNTVVQVVRNGEVIKEAANITELAWQGSEPGVYRIQAFQDKMQLPLLQKRRLPWILSNPIYVWKEPARVAVQAR